MFMKKVNIYNYVLGLYAIISTHVSKTAAATLHFTGKI